ncbi:hypothetical protein Q0M94_28505 (plasmid) [Deinococcus radiomollis]|uniref:hypothetical protein n=1 Tax=Deinococcus radiomollis TaxID=468916 RepID=UPI0038927CCF
MTGTEILPGKGKRGQLCNRQACQQPGATFYNTSTRAWYCPECARKINFWSLLDHNEAICIPESEVATPDPRPA